MFKGPETRTFGLALACSHRDAVDTEFNEWKGWEEREIESSRLVRVRRHAGSSNLSRVRKSRPDTKKEVAIWWVRVMR